MTQHEKILRCMVAHPGGITIRDGMMLGINWPHKRIAELEEQGVQVDRIDTEKDGTRFRLYRLRPGQDRVKQLMDGYRRARDDAWRKKQSAGAD